MASTDPPPAYVPPPPVYGAPQPMYGYSQPMQPVMMMQPMQQQQQQQQSIISVISQPMGLTACRHESTRSDATLLGLLCCIFFFPFGMLFCLLTLEKRCNHCGAKL